MADFASHGVLGAGICAGIARAFKAPRWVVNSATVYGAVFGAWPDAWPWLSTKLGWDTSAYLYTLYHDYEPWYLALQPPFLLHIWLDSFFHDPLKPGWDWWGEMGWLNIVMLAVSALLLWFAYGYKRE